MFLFYEDQSRHVCFDLRIVYLFTKVIFYFWALYAELSWLLLLSCNNSKKTAEKNACLIFFTSDSIWGPKRDEKGEPSSLSFKQNPKMQKKIHSYNWMVESSYSAILISWSYFQVQCIFCNEIGTVCAYRISWTRKVDFPHHFLLLFNSL